VGAIDLGRDGALKEMDRNDQTMTAAGGNEDAFKIGERAGLQSHSLPDAEIRMGLAERAGPDNALNRGDFPVRHRRGFASKADDIFHVRSRYYGEAVSPIEFTEYITGKQRRLKRLNPIGILAALGVCRTKYFKAPALKDILRGLFRASPNLKSEPV
jgi:hypothetical protein